MNDATDHNLHSLVYRVTLLQSLRALHDRVAGQLSRTALEDYDKKDVFVLVSFENTLRETIRTLENLDRVYREFEPNPFKELL